MSSRRDYSDYLRDMIHYGNLAQDLLLGIDLDAFAENEEKTLAVVHALQIIGEAAQKLPTAVTSKYPDIPWSDVVGMRNFIVHGYFLVDVEIVWKTVKEDLPPLVEALEKMVSGPAAGQE